MKFSISLACDTTDTQSMAALALLMDIGNGTSIASTSATVEPPVVAFRAEADEPGIAAAPNQLDGNGIPWNADIHSADPAMTAKGIWRRKRNIQDGFYETKVAELKAMHSGSMPVTAPVATPMPVTALAVTPTITSAAPAAPVAMPVTAPVAMPVTAPAAPVAEDFTAFMGAVSRGMNAGVIEPAYLQLVATHYGLANIGDASQRPDLIPNLFAQLRVDNKFVA